MSSVTGNAGAEVLVSDSGDMLYVSSRGVGMVIVYRLATYVCSVALLGIATFKEAVSCDKR